MTDKKKDKPFVFVRCLTYNHEKYIEDALKGFIMQKTDFPFVVVIVNDASPDNTKSVIETYINSVCVSDNIKYEQTEYAEIISATPDNNPNGLLYVLNLYENHFQKKSHRPYYKQFTDKATYWAECEGDDYWTDPYKLQKQVDFLENHPDYVACCHNAVIVSNGHRTLFNTLYESNNPTTQDIIERDWFIPTASLMYKHKIVKYPSWSARVANSDYMLLLLLVQQGKIYYMQDVMSVYRRHQGGISYAIQKNLVKFNDGMIRLMMNMKELYGGEYSDSFDKAIQKYEKRREDAERELYYAQHPLARALRIKTYKRAIKNWLRKFV